MASRTDPDRQIEHARESLMAHLAELHRRFRAARTRLDVSTKIAAHPLGAVGTAFALGALLGLRRGRRHQGGEVESKLPITALLGALAVRLAKELAMRGLTGAVREWWEGRQESPASEVRASYDPSLEPFLEH